MAKCVVHVGRGKNLSPGEAYENERKGWDEDAYRRKNQRPTNNYDWSRHDLNFEIVDGRVMELGSQETSLYERYQHLLQELEFKEYKAGASNQQLTYVELILSGNTDRMQQIAFGDQEVDYERNPPTWHNWDVHREKTIEEWALDNYKFVCKRYGKESVIGFEVHLDETAPHIHVNIVPVAVKKQRGNVSGYVKVDADGNPMTYAKGKHVGEVIKLSKGKYESLSDEKKKLYRPAVRGTIRTVSYAEHFGSTRKERRMKMSQLHDEYARVVGAKWGLERGDVWSDLPEEERRKRRRRTKKEAYEEELAKAAKESAEKERDESVAKRDAVAEEVVQLKSEVADNQRKIQDQKSSISKNNTIIISQLDSISDAKKEIMSFEKSSFIDKLARHGVNPKVRSAINEEKDRHQKELAHVEKLHQEELRDAKMAIDADGNPITRKGGGQLTWKEYADWLVNKNAKDKERLTAEKETAVAKAKAASKADYDSRISNLQNNHQKEIFEMQKMHQKDLMAFTPNGLPITWTSGSKQGQQMTKDERIKYLDSMLNTYYHHYECLVKSKKLLSSIVGMDLVNVIKGILGLVKAGAKAFTKEMMFLLLDTMKGINILEKRKSYIVKTFNFARVFAAMEGVNCQESNLHSLLDDAIRIADGTWEKYHQNLEREQRSEEKLETSTKVIRKSGRGR